MRSYHTNVGGAQQKQQWQWHSDNTVLSTTRHIIITNFSAEHHCSFIILTNIICSDLAKWQLCTRLMHHKLQWKQLANRFGTLMKIKDGSNMNLLNWRKKRLVQYKVQLVKEIFLKQYCNKGYLHKLQHALHAHRYTHRQDVKMCHSCLSLRAPSYFKCFNTRFSDPQSNKSMSSPEAVRMPDSRTFTLIFLIQLPRLINFVFPA